MPIAATDARNAGLRLAGLLGVIIAALALSRLYALVHALPLHEATPFEMLLAALGFVGMSAGSALLVLGRHIFDQIELPRRSPATPLHIPSEEASHAMRWTVAPANPSSVSPRPPRASNRVLLRGAR